MGRMTAAYDDFAEAYTAENENSLMNAYYERPATLALVGDATGRRILDAGCGSGPLFAALGEQGAVVTGIDQSAEMLAHARRRLGDGADLRVADLAGPLPFADGEFDDVVASLVLHYLRDWDPVLAELRRVLKPGGRLIASVNHPMMVNLTHRHEGPRPDYFAAYTWTDEFELHGEKARMTFWNKPLHAMTDAFTAAGFRIAVVSEPSCPRTAPSGISRAHSASSAARRSSPTSPVPTRTSRCTRFFTTLPSGTRWKYSRGPTPVGSVQARPELCSSYPSTSHQNRATRSGSAQSKVTWTCLTDVMQPTLGARASEFSPGRRGAPGSPPPSRPGRRRPGAAPGPATRGARRGRRCR